MDSGQLQLIKPEALSVSEYASKLGSALREVGGAILEGEVQEPSLTRGGMLYFDLTDGSSVLSCKVFRHFVKKLKQRPKHGDLVRVTVDRPDLFNGKLSLAVSEIELAGVGALLLKRAELLKRLSAAGLTDSDRWKPRPWLPKAVGVIAGRDSKGLTDVTRALIERFPPVSVVACPALVQGLKAPHDLIDALAHLDQDPRVQVIILARGGGSVQDLVAFDDEGLCKAVFACSTPVIAAVGHSDNVPVVNHVTWSATTPSRAPELAVPAAKELRLELATRRQALSSACRRLGVHSEQVAGCAGRIEVGSRLDARGGAVREVGASLGRAEERVFEGRERGLERTRATLNRVPLRLPKQERLAAPRARLDSAVRALFRDRAAEVARQCESLLAPSAQALARLARDVSAQGERTDAGVRRELADHERDYGRAAERLRREAQLGVERSLDGQLREVGHAVEILLAPGLQILGRHLQGIHEQGMRVEAGPMLERRAGSVRETGAVLTRAEERALIARERDLEQARASLSLIPLQLPSPDRLADSRARLDVAVRSLFRDRAAELERQGQALLAPGLQSIDRRLGAIHEQGERLTAGTRRELADHERDYSRATQRLVGDARQIIAKGLGERLDRLGGLGRGLGTGVTAQLGSARREAGHLAVLLKALDQRSRGWVLPQDEHGRVIKFPPGAPVGRRFSLNFRDGRQWVVAENIELEEESR